MLAKSSYLGRGNVGIGVVFLLPVIAAFAVGHWVAAAMLVDIGGDYGFRIASNVSIACH